MQCLVRAEHDYSYTYSIVKVSCLFWGI